MGKEIARGEQPPAGFPAVHAIPSQHHPTRVAEEDVVPVKARDHVAVPATWPKPPQENAAAAAGLLPIALLGGFGVLGGAGAVSSLS